MSHGDDHAQGREEPDPLLMLSRASVLGAQGPGTGSGRLAGY